mmetsp:Transcript_5798/g.20503  ORF Transcript_5798/g.20503 Transcript_5798/m.20503 type:complete len:80 (+) Transcript_5798:396-635(+)
MLCASWNRILVSYCSFVMFLEGQICLALLAQNHKLVRTEADSDLQAADFNKTARFYYMKAQDAYYLANAQVTFLLISSV